MKQATKHEWRLVINGAERSELSRAFNDSQWKTTWPNHMSRFDDSDPDAGYCVSLPIPDLDTLIAALKCVGHIRATCGMSLCGNADFASVRGAYSLCTRDSGFEVSSSVLHKSSKSSVSAMESQLTQAQNAIAELRMLIAESRVNDG